MVFDHNVLSYDLNSPEQNLIEISENALLQDLPYELPKVKRKKKKKGVNTLSVNKIEKILNSSKDDIVSIPSINPSL